MRDIKNVTASTVNKFAATKDKEEVDISTGEGKVNAAES